MSDRYINAEHFLSKLPVMTDGEEGFVSINAVKQAVAQTVDANVEPIVIGYWIEFPFGELRCSVCGMVQEDFPYKFKRCPECGARMQRGKCDE